MPSNPLPLKFVYARKPISPEVLSGTKRQKQQQMAVFKRIGGIAGYTMGIKEKAGEDRPTLAIIATAGIPTWPRAAKDVVAHEVGHYKLGHLFSAEGAPISKRWQQELGAWRYAIRTQKEKGTPVLPSTVQHALAGYKEVLHKTGYPKWKARQEMREVLRLAEKNPHSRPMTAREKHSLRFLMKQLRVPAVAVSISPDSSRDIAVYGGKLPHIICGRKWLTAGFDERLKRMTHELLHLSPGLRHNASTRRMGYYSNPERDTFTKKLYKMLTKRNPGDDYA